MNSVSSSDPQEPVLDPRRAAAVGQNLLDIGAVLLRPHAPFTWSSGLVAPVYCDNRQTLAHPSVRHRLREGFVDVMTTKGLLPATIAGTATAGIPHAAWLADALDAPMAYVRSSAKAHGTGRRIEGHRDPDGQAVVVEDLVSTGGSALEAVAALRQAGVDVSAVLAIFSYQFEVAATAFRDAGLSLYVLCTFEQLLGTARERGALDEDTVAELRAWRADPSAWSAERGGTRL